MIVMLPFLTIVDRKNVFFINAKLKPILCSVEQEWFENIPNLIIIYFNFRLNILSTADTYNSLGYIYIILYIIIIDHKF